MCCPILTEIWNFTLISILKFFKVLSFTRPVSDYRSKYASSSLNPSVKMYLKIKYPYMLTSYPPFKKRFLRNLYNLKFLTTDSCDLFFFESSILRADRLTDILSRVSSLLYHRNSSQSLLQIHCTFLSFTLKQRMTDLKCLFFLHLQWNYFNLKHFVL